MKVACDGSTYKGTETLQFQYKVVGHRLLVDSKIASSSPLCSPGLPVPRWPVYCKESRRLRRDFIEPIIKEFIVNNIIVIWDSFRPLRALHADCKFCAAIRLCSGLSQLQPPQKCQGKRTRQSERCSPPLLTCLPPPEGILDGW